MVPLRARLKNGDIVEIVTQAGHKPSRDWLNFVVTSHARYKIKHLIRLEERARALDLGRKVFEKELRRYDLSLKGVQETEAFAKALDRRRRPEADDLFALIGYGTLSAKQLLGKLVPADRLAREAAGRRGHGRRQARVRRRAKRRSRCAAPTMCWSSGRAAAIRSAARRSSATSPAARACRCTRRPVRTSSTCSTTPSAASTSSGTRRERRTGAGYTVKLTMEVEDRKGLLAAVSAKIADINTNIKNMEARTDDDQRARIDVTIEISDLKHLEKVIKSLRGVTGVLGRRAGRDELLETSKSES